MTTTLSLDEASAENEFPLIVSLVHSEVSVVKIKNKTGHQTHTRRPENKRISCEGIFWLQPLLQWTLRLCSRFHSYLTQDVEVLCCDVVCISASALTWTGIDI